MVSDPEGLTPPNPMPDLKLIALDADDLAVISAHLQDAVMKVGDLAFLPREKRFAAVANRFDWMDAIEKDGARDKRLCPPAVPRSASSGCSAPRCRGSTSRTRAPWRSCSRSASSPAIRPRAR